MVVFHAQSHILYKGNGEVVDRVPSSYIVTTLVAIQHMGSCVLSYVVTVSGASARRQTHQPK